MNTIRDGDLTLEPQTVAHAEAMFCLLGDPAIYEFENEPPPSLAWLRERYSRLEARRSPSGDEEWLNWVIRLPEGELAGFVQATIRADRQALIAYVLGSRYWGRGYAARALWAMMDDLASTRAVRHFAAIFKQPNLRSRRLLERLGFSETPSTAATRYQVDTDEALMELRR